jgi:hypothetical protein
MPSRNSRADSHEKIPPVYAFADKPDSLVVWRNDPWRDLTAMFRYYFSTREGKTEGPVSDAQLRDLQIGGLLPPNTRVCREGTNVWRPITPLYVRTAPSETSPSSVQHPFRQPLALVGSALLFVGVFCPIVSVPIVGQMNYFQNGKGDGTILLVLAAASAIIAVAKRFRLLWLTGGGALVLLIITFIRFQLKLSEMKSQVKSDLHDNPFAGLADLAIESVQIQWGLAILVLGSVLVISAAAMRAKA